MDDRSGALFGEKKMDNNIIITIQQLLIGRNPDFDKAQRVKLVRHKDDNVKFKTPRFLPCNGKRNNCQRRNFN